MYICTTINNQNIMKNSNINNGKINESFLMSLDGKTYQAIVGSMAKHYGISIDQATDELIGEDAENILEYLVGEVRTAAYIIYQKWAISTTI